MVNENATHQKHVDEERQYVQDGRQKGQNGAPRGSKLNAKMIPKIINISKSAVFHIDLLWMAMDFKEA